MEWPYPDHKIRWPDGTEIPAPLRDQLLSGLGEDLEIQHGEFAWGPDGSLDMKFRLSADRAGRAESWDVELCYPANEAGAAKPDSAPEERDWFTFMVRTHLDEWWLGGGSPSVTARRRKVR